MLRRVLLIAAIVAFAAPAAAQAQDWQVRTDQSQSASDPDNTSEIQFTALGTDGFRYVGGPAGTRWRPSETATGNYTLSATFTLNEPSDHTTYYGLVFGVEKYEELPLRSQASRDVASFSRLLELTRGIPTNRLISRSDGFGRQDLLDGSHNVSKSSVTIVAGEVCCRQGDWTTASAYPPNHAAKVRHARRHR